MKFGEVIMHRSKSFLEREESSTLGLIFYSIFYSAITLGCFLIFAFVAPPSIPLPVRIISSLCLGSILGGGAFGCIALICIAELIERFRLK